MLLGVKVVRGPDWKWSDQDEGEGTIGTLIKYGTHGSEVIVNGTGFVQWDTGGNANYRVGRDGAYDLRLFDTAVAGEQFYLSVIQREITIMLCNLFCTNVVKTSLFDMIGHVH